MTSPCCNRVDLESEVRAAMQGFVQEGALDGEIVGELWRNIKEISAAMRAAQAYSSQQYETFKTSLE